MRIKFLSMAVSISLMLLLVNCGADADKGQVVTYTVTFSINGGTGAVPSAQRVFPGSTISLPGNTGFSRSGYIFRGWNTSGNASGTDYIAGEPFTPVKSVTLYAKWEELPPDSFVVTFLVNTNLHVPEDRIVAKGAKIERPDNPVRSGYSFEGWYKPGLTERWNFEVDTVSDDIMLSGKWSEFLSGKWTVRFVRNGGAPFPEDIAVPNGAGSSGVPYISKAGSVFGGWFRDAACTEQPWLFSDDAVVSDTTLYAKWNEPDYYTVNFITNGGSPVGQQIVAFTGAADAVFTTRPGYIFNGWFEESALVSEWDFANYKVQSNLNLHAAWIGNPLTINYEDGGGEGSAPASPVSAANGTSVTMPANTYTRANYSFVGWEVSGEGSSAGTYAAGASVAVADLSTVIENGPASITLTAVWTINTLTINYDSGISGFPPISPVLAVSGTNITIPENIYRSVSSVFEGWEVTGAGSIPGIYAAGEDVEVTALSTAIANGNASVTLKAKWKTNFTLGDTGPGGGKIFYYNASGWVMTDNYQICHYLEAAPDNIPGMLKWWNGSANIISTGTTIGTGRANTAAIPVAGSSVPAARACKDYLGPNNFIDWFLPSKDELNQLYINRTFVGNMSVGTYWSSSQDGNNSAWTHYFNGGGQISSSKTNSYNVRAVRAF